MGMKLEHLAVGDKLLWQHRKASELKDQATHPEQLQRYVTVKAVFEDYIKTDFGDYLRYNGFNVDAACGCKRFCNCWGEVKTLKSA